MASPELTALSIANAPQQNQPSVTSEGQAAATRIRAARQARNTAMEPTVSATNLAEPVEPVTVPQPEVPTQIANPLGSAEQTLGNIRSQSERARELAENERTIGSFMEGETAINLNQRMLEEFGVTPDVIRQRGEIGNQLASLIAASELKKVGIESGGQGAMQGVRSLNQQDRETAIFAKQLESQAAVLDGQINLGRQLAGDAVNLMLQDRDFQYKNLIRQNQALQGQVDEETRQLLVAENRGYEEKLAEDQRFKAGVDSAIASGAATNDEIASLTSPLPTHPDPATQEQLQTQAIQERQALAQSITARGAGELRDLGIQQTQASIRSSNASAALNELDLKLTQEAATRAEEDAANGVLPLEGVAIAQTINKDFEDEPIVKQYNDALAKAIVLEDTLENGIDGIQDLQLVYEFMKAVDPASVVRETEFATAAETGNIFQGSYARFNKAFGTGGFLPEQVKEDFIRAARSSFDAKNTQYFNIKNEKAKQINQRLGITNGADYLTAYESAAPLQTVDFELADSLSGATEQDMLDIMQMQQDLLASPSGQLGR